MGIVLLQLSELLQRPQCTPGDAYIGVSWIDPEEESAYCQKESVWQADTQAFYALKRGVNRL